MDAPQRTPDGRYVVIDGRRWRATDPTLPDDRRQALVDELMAARRAVAAAKRSGDDAAQQAARRRVHAAKVALGERGPKWWEGIEQAIREAVAATGAGSTVCPSQVARTLAGDERFRDLMPHVREAAATLAERGELVVTQRGKAADARTASGPIRLGLPADAAPAPGRR